MSNIGASDNLAKEAQCIRGAVATEVQAQRPGDNVELGQTVASGAQAEVQTVEGVVKQVYETPYGGESTRAQPLGTVQVGGTTTIGGTGAAGLTTGISQGTTASQLAGQVLQTAPIASVGAATATGMSGAGVAGTQTHTHTVGHQTTGTTQTGLQEEQRRAFN